MHGAVGAVDGQSGRVESGRGEHGRRGNEPGENGQRESGYGEGTRISPNLTRWAFIFPNAGFAMATIQMGKAYDSLAIKLLACVMTGLLFVGWVAVGVALGWKEWKKKRG